MQEINSLSILTHQVIQSNAAVVVGILAEKEAVCIWQVQLTKSVTAPLTLNTASPVFQRRISIRPGGVDELYFDIRKCVTDYGAL